VFDKGELIDTTNPKKVLLHHRIVIEVAQRITELVNNRNRDAADIYCVQLHMISIDVHDWAGGKIEGHGLHNQSAVCVMLIVRGSSYGSRNDHRDRKSLIGREVNTGGVMRIHGEVASLKGAGSRRQWREGKHH